MAIKSKLETTFTGNDRPFQRTANRIKATGARLQKMATGLGAAFAALGGTMLVKQTMTKFDRIDKIAKRMGMSAEMVHKLGYAAKLSGSNIEQLQAILTRLNRRIGEAMDPRTGAMSSAAQGFAQLGLNAKDLKDLSPEEQLFAMADAFVATGAGAEGFAALMKVLDTEVREMMPLFKTGSEGIKNMMDEIQSPTQQTVDELVRMNDMFTQISETGLAKFALAVGKAFEKFSDLGMFLGEQFLKIEAIVRTDKTLEDAVEAIEYHREQRLKEEEKRLAAQAKRDLFFDEPPGFLGGLEKEEKEKSNLLTSGSGSIFSSSMAGGFFGHGAAAQPAKFPGLTELKKMQNELAGLRNDIRESLK